MSTVPPPAAEAAETSSPSPTQKAWRTMRISEYVLPLVVVVLLIVGSLLKPGVFFTDDNLLNVLVQASVAGIVAVGMTFVIATGGIDLSVGSVLAATAVFGGLLATGGEWNVTSELSLQFPELGTAGFLVGALLFGLGLGAINGLAISWLRIVPFIATLAMLTIGRGLSLNMSGRTPITLTNLDFVLTIGQQKFLTIPIPAIIFLVVTALGWLLLNRTRYGRYVVAVGGNREAARIAGIRTRQIVFSVYALTGLLVGVASVLLAGRLGSASPVAGNLLELDAIAAVVIGGTALTGGRATIVGTFFGVLTFALVFNLLNLLNMPTELQQIVRGVIILAAVAVQRRDR